MMQVLKDIGGVELPDSLVKLGSADGVVPVAPASPNGAHAEAAVAGAEVKL